MPLYKYEGTTPEDEPKSGTVEAPSRMIATVKLRQAGLRIHTLAEVPSSVGRADQDRRDKVQYSPWYPLKPVPSGALSDFYAQLHELLSAGVSIHDSVDALQGRVHPRLRPVMQDLVPAIAAGEGATENLAKYPQIFPAHVQAMLKVGETAGNLDEIASVLAQQYDEEHRLAQMLLLPKMYYGLVLIFCILIPTFPWIISRGFSWYLHELITVLIPIIAVIIALLLLGKVVLGTPAGKSLTDDIVYRLPWLSLFAMRAAHTRVLSSLHILMRAGVDLPTALELVAPASGLRPMHAELDVAAKRIREQVPVSVALGQCGALSDRAKAALGTAEQSGLYEEALARLAGRVAEERQASIKKIATLGTLGATVITAVLVGIAVYFGFSAYINAILERAEEWMP